MVNLVDHRASLNLPNNQGLHTCNNKNVFILHKMIYRVMACYDGCNTLETDRHVYERRQNKYHCH